jgi:hypothetical protein
MVILILKGMTDALAPFSNLVNNIVRHSPPKKLLLVSEKNIHSVVIGVNIFIRTNFALNMKTVQVVGCLKSC